LLILSGYEIKLEKTVSANLAVIADPSVNAPEQREGELSGRTIGDGHSLACRGDKARRRFDPHSIAERCAG
jgi:hypothetical protein